MAWTEWKKFSSREDFYAEGTSTEASVSISGLGFQPDIVILWQNNPNLTIEAFDFTLNNAYWIHNGASGGCNTNINSVTIRRTEDGFYNRVDVFSASSTNPLHWRAIKVTESNRIALIPLMTSNTTPSGVVSTNVNNSNPWYAFDGSQTTGWGGPNGSPSSDIWLAYTFANPVKANTVKLNFDYGGTWGVTSCSYKIQGSNDGTNWDDLSEVYTDIEGIIEKSFNNDKYYTSYRLFILSQTRGGGSTAYGGIIELQLYK